VLSPLAHARSVDASPATDGETTTASSSHGSTDNATPAASIADAAPSGDASASQNSPSTDEQQKNLSIIQTAIIQGIFFLAVSILSYFGWKRYGHRDYLQFSLLAVLGVLVNVWSAIARDVLKLPPEIRLVNSRILLVFWIIFVISVLVIAFKRSHSK